MILSDSIKQLLLIHFEKQEKIRNSVLAFLFLMICAIQMLFLPNLSLLLFAILDDVYVSSL